MTSLKGYNRLLKTWREFKNLTPSNTIWPEKADTWIEDPQLELMQVSQNHHPEG